MVPRVSGVFHSVFIMAGGRFEAPAAGYGGLLFKWLKIMYFSKIWRFVAKM